ncbi:serpin family protein [Neomegalonema perideroedes]|uniref:serpin family protein n=1 Tax=Neomegalonema perideroedes TaxID=217219 RepID=UPI0003A53167|nr:serpin family protein [Neomegalonema perideroedes]
MRPSPTLALLGAALLCGACREEAAAQISAAPPISLTAPAAAEAPVPTPEGPAADGAQAVRPARAPLPDDAPAQAAEAAPLPAAISAEAPQASADAPAEPGAQSRALDLTAAPLDGEVLTMRLLEALGAGGSANVLLSPESARFALGMTAEGASEEAASPLLAPPALPSEEGSSLASANALWLDEEAEPLPGFTERLAQKWGAELRRVRFADGPAAAAQIDAWTSEKTQGRIPRLLDVPPSAQTELILTNALVFKADWSKAFDPAKTVEGPFRPAGGARSVAVPLMTSAAVPVFGSAEGLEAAVLPFADPRLSLLLALPREDAPLAAQLHALERLARPESREPSQALRMTALVLPKLRLEGGAELKEALSAVGFGPLLNAPLSRASKAAPHPSAVTQKVSVEWDEEGATAAAATAVAATRSLALASDAPLRFDRPFYFLILREGARAPLFAGYVADPRPAPAR